MAALVTACCRSAVAGDAAEIVRRHLAHFDGAASLTLRVERQTTQSGKTTTERWTVQQRGAAHLRIDCEFPLRRLLVADGRELWEYIPQARKARRTDLAAMKPDARAAFLRRVFMRTAVEGLRFNAGGPEAKLTYRGREQIGGRAAHYIECHQPTAKAARRVRGWIDAERLVLLRCEFIDAKGQVVATSEAGRVFEAAPGFWFPRQLTFKHLGGRGLAQVVTFREVVVGAKLPDSLFEFSVPEGVEVVGDGRPD